MVLRQIMRPGRAYALLMLAFHAGAVATSLTETIISQLVDKF